MARKKERKRARDRAFLLSGWWALKNGNPIVSTAHRRSFTADTRKLTLNRRFPLFFSTSRPSSFIFFQILLSVFPKNTKRDESPPPNSKIFHVKPETPFSKKKLKRISYITEALNEEFNSIAYFRMPMREALNTNYIFWHHF